MPVARANYNWRKIHSNIRRLANTKTAYDVEEAQWLLAGLRSNVHQHLGYATFIEYMERLFGYSPRTAFERLRVARCLESLPETRQALQSGDVCWSSVRELSRVATADTESEWLDAARHKTVRDVEQMVNGRAPGDLPGDPARPGLQKHVIYLEVSADTYASFRDARRKVELDAGESLSDDDALREMARAVLRGPKEDGRSNYQIAMTQCESCHRTWVAGAGTMNEVDSATAEMAGCDAQTIGSAHAGKPGRASQHIPPATRRQVLLRDNKKCAVPGCRASRFIDVHHVIPREHGGSHEMGNLVCLCGAHHRAVHDCRLQIRGTAPDDLVFQHPDGAPYGTA